MVKKNTAKESLERIINESAIWLVLLKDLPRVSLHQRWQFLCWLVRSHRHVYVFFSILRQDALLTRVLRAQRRSSKVSDARCWQRSSQTQRRRETVGWNVAAMIVLIVVLCFSLDSNNELPRMELGNSSVPTDAPDHPAIVAAKEPADRRLSDGTRVSLQADSTLHVEFTSARRDVRLEGKALFEIASDATRPFSVNSLWVEIIPQDESKFAVSIDSHVEVEVYEGAVGISGRGAGAGTAIITLKRGESYRVPIERFREIVADGRGGLRMLIEG